MMLLFLMTSLVLAYEFLSNRNILVEWSGKLSLVSMFVQIELKSLGDGVLFSVIPSCSGHLFVGLDRNL